MTLQDFIAQNGITMTCERVRENPWMLEGNMSRHFLCHIRYDEEQAEFYFSQGSAHASWPTLEDVLDCLASDAAHVENASDFAEWAFEYGFELDTLEDYRKYENMYKVTQTIAYSLQRLLGDDAYDTLLWDTERL